MAQERSEHPGAGVERLVGRDLDEDSGKGRRLSSTARQSQRTVEAYLKGGVRPRWMERVAEIDAWIDRERRAVALAHRAHRRDHAADPERFAKEWTATAQAWPFGELNELIAQHNEWYPIERRLPINPRTGEYVRMGGRSYRREPLGPDWILERVPARPWR